MTASSLADDFLCEEARPAALARRKHFLHESRHLCVAGLRKRIAKVKAPTISTFLAAELAEGGLLRGGRAGARVTLGNALAAPLAQLHPRLKKLAKLCCSAVALAAVADKS